MARRRADGSLTVLEARFVEEYLVDLNATQAANRAGYKTDKSRRIGHDLVNRPCIAAEIARRLVTLSVKLEATHEQVRSKLLVIAFDPRADGEGGPTPDQRISALREYGKLQGWYTERHHHTGGLTLEQLLAGADRKEAEEKRGTTQ